MSQYAPAKRIQSFHPPQRTLMGPGPTEIHPRVLTTMSQPAIGYLDPVFVEMMEELKSLLRYVYQTKNALTFPLSGPGLGRHGVLLRQHGGAGRQGRSCARTACSAAACSRTSIRCGGTPVLVEDKWGEPVDPQKVEDALKKNTDAKIVAFVHAETSTGAQSDAKALDADRAQARRDGDRRRGHLARRHAGAGRRVGHRRRSTRRARNACRARRACRRCRSPSAWSST